MEKVITIPKELTRKGELAIIPHSEYEKFLCWQKSIKTFKPTPSEKRALRQARKDFAMKVIKANLDLAKKYKKLEIKKNEH